MRDQLLQHPERLLLRGGAVEAGRRRPAAAGMTGCAAAAAAVRTSVTKLVKRSMSQCSGGPYSNAGRAHLRSGGGRPV